MIIDANLRQQIERDIEHVLAKIPESIPELGPAGKYTYTTSSGSNGNLKFKRRGATAAENEEFQVLLSLDLHQHELRSMSLSIDESMLVYCISSVLDPLKHQVFVKHLLPAAETVSNVQLQFPVHMNPCSVEFGPLQLNGAHSLFFTTANELNRPDSVFCCELESNCLGGPSLQVQPALVYTNSDEATVVDVQRTKGCQYAAISAATKTTNEIRLVRQLSSPPLLVRARQIGVHYHMDVGKDNNVYLLANACEANHASGLDEELTLFVTKTDDLPLGDHFGKKMLDESLANNKEFVIEDLDIFSKALVLYERSAVDGSQRIRVKVDGSDEKFIQVPSLLNPCGNMYYDSDSLLFTQESPVQAPTTLRFSFCGKNLQPYSPHTTSADETSSDDDTIVHSRMLVESSDGVKVPLSLFHSRSVDPMQRMNPVILNGYGAYGEPVMRGYDPLILPLIRRGCILAYAHTRGGGELGRTWYQQGRQNNKPNVVEDFLACARSLVDDGGITEPSLLSARAFSAGGVAVGAAINREPNLFGAAVFTNAFLDVTTSMMNKMTLTDHEIEEWGDPSLDARAAQIISSICPMHNLVNGKKYPPTLIIGTVDDANVPCSQSVAYQAKLKECTTGIPPLLHIIDHGGHHMHGTKLGAAALEHSFILSHTTTSRC